MLEANYILRRFCTPMRVKAAKAMQGSEPFGFRLARLNALDNNPGRVWSTKPNAYRF